jgi:hypothetical protein
MKYATRYPKTTAAMCWLVSLFVGAFVLVLGEFGGPAWLFVVCFLWLLTLGLPTTVSIVTLAALWGDFAGLGTPPLAAFLVCVLILSLALHVALTFATTRLFSRWRAK